MSFKNSLKLLASNFSVVWKHLVYLLITSAITVGLILAFAGPSVDCLQSSGWVDKASSVFQTVYTESRSVYSVIKEVVSSFFDVLGDNFSDIWFSIIGLIITAYLIPTIFAGIGNYNLTSITQKKMTSLLNVGYTQNLISNLKPACAYSFVRMLFKLPFDLIKIVVVVTLFDLSTTFITKLLFLFLMFTLLIIISTLEMVTFAGFAPYMVEKGGNAFKCFYKSTVPVFKKFEKNFSNAIVITLTCLFVNGILALFTAFSGLLITVPASLLFIVFYGNVVYLSCTNKRYYLSSSIIVNPNVDESKPFETKDNI